MESLDLVLHCFAKWNIMKFVKHEHNALINVYHLKTETPKRVFGKKGKKGIP